MKLGVLREVRDRSVATFDKGVRVATHLRTYLERMKIAKERAATLAGPALEEAKLLRDKGLTPVTADGNVPEILTICRALATERADTAPRTGKAFFAQLIKPEDIWANPTLLQGGLEPHVLDVLMGTYGQLPFLESIELLVSYSNGNAPLSQSQQWHMDRTDSMVVKQIIYIQDVGPQNGPLSLLPPDESRKVPYLSPHYMSDDEIARYVDLSQLITFEGMAGSRFLADTGRCFHYGSRVKARRLALFYYYNTGYAKFPRQGLWRDTPAAEMNWSPLQRRVLDLA